MSVVTFGPKSKEERLRDVQNQKKALLKRADDFDKQQIALQQEAARDPGNEALQSRIRIAGYDAAKARRDAAKLDTEAAGIKAKIKIENATKKSATVQNLKPRKPAPAAVPIYRSVPARPGQYYQSTMGIDKVIAVNLVHPDERKYGRDELFYTYVPMKVVNVYNVGNAQGKQVNITRLADKVNGEYVEDPATPDYYSPVWPKQSPTDKNLWYERMSSYNVEYDSEANKGFETDSDYWRD
jgi:hypothetical protein